MICDRCDKQTMLATGAQHECPVCHRVVTLTDFGYVPSAGFTPAPYRTEPVIFRPLELLEEEIGWEQNDAPTLAECAPKRPHPARLPEGDPRREAWRDKLSAGVHRANRDPDVKAARSEAQRRRVERERRRAESFTTRQINEATRQRARNGELARQRYAEQRRAS